MGEVARGSVTERAFLKESPSQSPYGNPQSSQAHFGEPLRRQLSRRESLL